MHHDSLDSDFQPDFQIHIDLDNFGCKSFFRSSHQGFWGERVYLRWCIVVFGFKALRVLQRKDGILRLAVEDVEQQSDPY